MQLLAGRWTLALLGELSSGGRRYQELRDVLDGISHKVLTETLRRAERGGLIRRQLDHDRIETATLYQLTELGRSLELPLSACRAVGRAVIGRQSIWPSDSGTVGLMAPPESLKDSVPNSGFPDSSIRMDNRFLALESSSDSSVRSPWSARTLSAVARGRREWTARGRAPRRDDAGLVR